MIALRCPHCFKDSTTDDRHDGECVDCPHCLAAIQVGNPFRGIAASVNVARPKPPSSPIAALGFLCSVGSLVLAFVAVQSPLLNANMFALGSLIAAFVAVGLSLFMPRTFGSFASGTVAVLAVFVSLIILMMIQNRWSNLVR